MPERLSEGSITRAVSKLTLKGITELNTMYRRVQNIWKHLSHTFLLLLLSRFYYRFLKCYIPRSRKSHLVFPCVFLSEGDEFQSILERSRTEIMEYVHLKFNKAGLDSVNSVEKLDTDEIPYISNNSPQWKAWKWGLKLCSLFEQKTPDLSACKAGEVTSSSRGVNLQHQALL